MTKREYEMNSAIPLKSEFHKPQLSVLIALFFPRFYFNLIAEKVFDSNVIQIWQTNLVLVIDCFLFFISSGNIFVLVENYVISRLYFLKLEIKVKTL